MQCERKKTISIRLLFFFRSVEIFVTIAFDLLNGLHLHHYTKMASKALLNNEGQISGDDTDMPELRVRFLLNHVFF